MEICVSQRKHGVCAASLGRLLHHYAESSHIFWNAEFGSPRSVCLGQIKDGVCMSLRWQRLYEQVSRDYQEVNQRTHIYKTQGRYLEEAPLALDFRQGLGSSRIKIT